MKFAKTLCATAVLGLFVASTAGATDHPEKWRQLFGELDPANPGWEVMVPFFKGIDGNGDGYPEKMKVSFRVYSVGSTTLLRETPSKTFSTPDIPAGCEANNPSKYFNFDFDIRIARREDQPKFIPSASGTVPAQGGQWNYVFGEGSHRAHMALNMSIDCWDGSSNQYTQGAIVYSGNLAGVEEKFAGGSMRVYNPVDSWLKTYPGKQVNGLQGIDIQFNNSNGYVDDRRDMINDTLSVVAIGPTGAGANAWIFYYDGGTGDTKTVGDQGSVTIDAGSYQLIR